MDQKTRRFLRFLALFSLPFAAALVLLLALNGPTDLGLECTRSPSAAGQCTVLQSQFLGLLGNRSFAIPEAQISDARVRCAGPGVGRRSGPNCNVNIILKSGPYDEYPVLSYALVDQANASAAKIQAYLKDSGIASLRITDDTTGTLTILLSSVLFVLVLGAIAWVVRRRPSKA